MANPSHFETPTNLEQADIPIFAITLGQADERQLCDIAEWTRA